LFCLPGTTFFQLFLKKIEKRLFIVYSSNAKIVLNKNFTILSIV